MNAASTTAPDKPNVAPPREFAKVLADARDFVVQRLIAMLPDILDKIGDNLRDRALKSDLRDEQQLYLDARDLLRLQRRALLEDFEARMRRKVDDCIAGRGEERQDFAKADASALALVDTNAMERSVLIGNIKRVIENACHDELVALNRATGFLLGRQELETEANPLAPATFVDAFSDAVGALRMDERVTFQVLREFNQTSLVDITAIYADLNQNLAKLKFIPTRSRPAARPSPDAKRDRPRPAATGEVDMNALFQRMFAHAPRAMPQIAVPPLGPGDVPIAALRPFAPLAPTPSGYVPGMPIIESADLHEGLVRLQAGQTNFEIGGATVQFSGIPTGLHNVLRDLQESPLGAKVSQLESMTIEMVAMLFDFVFETKDLPDGIKALLARLQIPVLKAAMLDGAFFAKKTHPARTLVNRLAEAGLGWSPVMGNDDPLYRKIEAIVHRVLDDFSDDLSLFDTLREDLEAFLADEEKAAESNIATTAEEINQHDRLEVASAVARSEVEKRIESHAVPTFLANFLRRHWQRTLTHVYANTGEDSETWNSGVATLEDLVWSVQPKRTQEDRKHLVALLPSLLKRLSAGMQLPGWPQEDRERFMSNLVEAHAAAVKPSLANVDSPSAAIAEQAKAQAQLAKASGDDATAQRAEALAEAMSPAPPAPEEPPPLEDEYLDIARHMERGMWVEFANADGQLAFTKLAWVSPLRGTYLFTNRQGQRALSITAEELAEHFRSDRARLVEAEPLIDRAVNNMIVQFEEKFAVPVA